MVGIKDFEMPSCCNSCEHWRFNRDDDPLCELTYEYIRQFDKRQDDCPLIEAIPKADYENRLKADMVAMLKELKLEFETYEPKWAENEDQVIASNRTWDDFDDIIQQKIDLLRSKN